MPLLQTSGNDTADAYGGGVAAVPNYIEDVFQTWLYQGNDSTQTINNGIDLAGKGGLVWIKPRDLVEFHSLFDTNRGVQKYLSSSQTSAEATGATTLTAFNSNGFSLGGATRVNAAPYNIVSWTFRKQPKFFDVVTYTGNGDSNRNIPHGLGSVPGCIIVKETDAANGWAVYHRTLADGDALQLQSTGATASTNFFGPNSAQTATVFQTGSSNITYTNGTDKTYVAYLFAHNAGGFGLTGTDNVISCGSFTTDGSGNATVSLGYEPQFLITKQSSGTGYWRTVDTMRGWSVYTGGGSDAELYPNASAAENFGGANLNGGYPTATGFVANGGVYNASSTYIYIAIRRGPMKVPTDATKVFAPVARTGTGSVANVSVGFAPDFLTTFYRTDAGQDKVVFDRLRGPTQYLNTAATTQQIDVGTNGLISFNNTSFTTNANGYANNSGSAFVNHVFGRAPNFFDEVCYSGSGVGTSQTHNLGVIPELKIIKSRSGAVDWVVGGSIISGVGGRADSIILNSTAAVVSNSTYWAAADTSTTFSVRAGNGMSDGSGSTYVAYLFATCAGVSKVGSYTGTGATQTISCGFTGGARFVLVKRTDDVGDWYVWDTARGMVSGTDPSLKLNTTAAEVNANSIYTTTGGFQIVSTAAGINASGGSYLFFAVA